MDGAGGDEGGGGEDEGQDEDSGVVDGDPAAASRERCGRGEGGDEGAGLGGAGVGRRSGGKDTMRGENCRPATFVLFCTPRFNSNCFKKNWLLLCIRCLSMHI